MENASQQLFGALGVRGDDLVSASVAAALFAFRSFRWRWANMLRTQTIDAPPAVDGRLLSSRLRLSSVMCVVISTDDPLVDETFARRAAAEAAEKRRLQSAAATRAAASDTRRQTRIAASHAAHAAARTSRTALAAARLSERRLMNEAEHSSRLAWALAKRQVERSIAECTKCGKTESDFTLEELSLKDARRCVACGASDAQRGESHTALLFLAGEMLLVQVLELEAAHRFLLRPLRARRWRAAITHRRTTIVTARARRNLRQRMRMGTRRPTMMTHHPAPRRLLRRGSGKRRRRHPFWMLC